MAGARAPRDEACHDEFSCEGDVTYDIALSRDADVAALLVPGRDYIVYAGLYQPFWTEYWLGIREPETDRLHLAAVLAASPFPEEGDQPSDFFDPFFPVTFPERCPAVADSCGDRITVPIEMRPDTEVVVSPAIETYGTDDGEYTVGLSGMKT